jgi:serine/threonine-protein kinase
MAKDPAGRFSGSDEVVEALEPFLGNLHDIPGGMPGSNPRMPGSNPRMPGTGSRPGSSGSAPKMPGLPSKNPSTSSLPSLPGRANSYPSAPSPATRTPSPLPSRSNAGIPSRASFQLPPLESDTETGEMGRNQTPVEVARPAPKFPGRPAAAATMTAPASKSADRKMPAAPPAPVAEAEEAPAWAEGEKTAQSPRSGFGPLGLVAAAVFLTVAVYLGATLLMKH